MLKRFRHEIAAQMREGQVKMEPNQMARARASKTIGNLVRAWPYLERVQQMVRAEGMKVFADNPEVLERFRRSDSGDGSYPLFQRRELSRPWRKD